uniref:Protein kinase domain-containing protein n=1 Tax=Trichuris muris TaxID=70415 RepID=A0A5S6Q1Q9_TRIMR
MMGVKQGNKRRQRTVKSRAERRRSAQPIVNKGEMLAGHWRLISKIGNGGFREVHTVRDAQRKLVMATKVAIDKIKEGVSLERQVRIMRALTRSQHICKAYWRGVDGTIRYVIITLAGLSLEYLRYQRPRRKFTQPTVLTLFKSASWQSRSCMALDMSTGTLSPRIPPSAAAEAVEKFCCSTLV